MSPPLLRAALTAAFLAGLAGLAPATAAAQVQVVEEEQAGDQIVERGQIREGRGTQLGLYLASPIYATPLRRDDGQELPVLFPGAVAGVRGGWELPVGLALELYLEGGLHGVDNPGVDPRVVMLQLGVGGSARFLFFNPTAFVPFVQASLGVRLMGFDWPDGREAEGATLDIGGGIGAQIELTAHLGLELGMLVGALLPGNYFADTALWLHPFAGVTFYTDENESPQR